MPSNEEVRERRREANRRSRERKKEKLWAEWREIERTRKENSRELSLVSEVGSSSPPNGSVGTEEQDDAERKRAEQRVLERERREQRASMVATLAVAKEREEKEKQRLAEEARKQRLEERKRRLGESQSPEPSNGTIDEASSSKAPKVPTGPNSPRKSRQMSVVCHASRAATEARKGRTVQVKQTLSTSASLPRRVRPSARAVDRSRSLMISSTPTTSLASPRKKTNKPSPMKTRGLQKKTALENAETKKRCALCRMASGKLFSCGECRSNYHLVKCLLYSEEVAETIEASRGRQWKCPRCVHCLLCGEFIADPTNVECAKCGLVIHGQCNQKGDHYINDQSLCKICAPKSPQKDGKSKTEEVKSESKSSQKTPIRRGRKSKAVGWFVEPNESTRHIIEERNELYNQVLDSVKAGMENGSNSPRRKNSSRSPDKKEKSRPISLQADIDLYEEAKRALAEERGETSQRHGRVKTESVSPGKGSVSKEGEPKPAQWIYVGCRRDKMLSVYSAKQFHPDIASSPRILICPFCLRANHDLNSFNVHQRECTWRYPPGDEIYRDNGISFFEVDGSKEKNYCQRVCQLGKLFISSKTLINEVETFLFYILTEHTDDGMEFVGYFSKEKNPSKNNNLSCLLTLPSAQRSGYGRLLIDLSYQLSRVERKIGSPEHPLSDLGLLAYRGFWRSAILCHLRSLRGVCSTSVKQMSLATRIAPADIISQLHRDGLLLYRDGVYYVNAERRAYRMSLCASRRRTIDSSRLVWQPSFDVKEFDPSKLNYYV